MERDVARAIEDYYPHRLLVSPLTNPNIRWTYDANSAVLKAIVEDLKAVGADPVPGPNSGFDISEELRVFGGISLLLSYLGPWAAFGPSTLDEGDDLDRAVRLKHVREILTRHGVRVLEECELREAATWITPLNPRGPSATVFGCLFVNELDGDVDALPTEASALLWR